ncbi:hypothetical protein [Pelagicoccus sp. SDUM812002]|uniref:hypothetical protein n=1 Tax=Pelagicoccus sp. SDUM812002 TaxID=3041266 RepID=UPI00280F4207|nr:hypothetical protein [Pelagicoccus sp. SDUM812002]MDQ8187680.1 hypothetical protein [Pelagicoccus sp. SDUM812002]
MTLATLWKSDSQQLTDKSIQQLFAFAGKEQKGVRLCLLTFGGEVEKSSNLGRQIPWSNPKAFPNYEVAYPTSSRRIELPAPQWVAVNLV